MGQVRYYPSSRVLTNQSTTGNLFVVSTTGQPYVGPYYLTYDGKAFTGANPTIGSNILLIPSATAASYEAESSPSIYARAVRGSRLSPKSGLSAINNVQDAYSVNPINPQTTLAELKQLQPYYPIAIDTDYQRGYMKRYFAKKVNVRGYIMEISYEDWATIKNSQDNTYEDYEVLELLWQVTGPKNDKRVSQYQIISGVYDTNKRITENKAKGFVGLVEYIGGDYTKLARLDP